MSSVRQEQTAEYAGATATMLTVWQPESSGDLDVPLWSKTGTEVQTYIVDGNKNVRQLKNAAGTPSPWQFSSEYRDAETGLVYYNYRYYAFTIGRWLTRDPIEEKGGLNLYMILHNNIIYNLEYYGLGEYTVSQKTIDLSLANNNDISEKAAMDGNENGFSVSYTPNKADLKKCKCGEIYLSQAISNTATGYFGFGSRSPHIDASGPEYAANKKANYVIAPPRMTPKDQAKYSYYDSSTATASQGILVEGVIFSISPSAICIPTERPYEWFVLDGITFKWDNFNRTFIDEKSESSFTKEGGPPSKHWNTAIKTWSSKK